MPSPPGLIGRVTAPEVVSRIWRTEAARLVAGLTRMTQDLALAEDLAQDALVEADTYEQAVESARKIVQVHTDHWPTWEGEAEVRQVMG